MNQMQTIVPVPQIEQKLTYQSTVLTVGSCFAQNIGAFMQQQKFSVAVNPFGIVYNPMSIAQSLTFLAKKDAFGIDDLVENQSIWHSLFHHSDFSGVAPDAVLHRINHALKSGQEQWQQANAMLITFGTAFVYKYLPRNCYVANCHKLPKHQFAKIRLSVADILEAFVPVLHELMDRPNPPVLIFSVSPVRHLRDGIIENQRSKSILLLAVEELLKHFHNAYYFPAYELMMDEFRDYRYYSKDLIHPSELAIDLIWERFKESFFAPKSLQINQQIGTILRRCAHRPRFPGSEAHKKFVSQTLTSITQFTAKYPFISFDHEKEQLEKSLL